MFQLIFATAWVASVVRAQYYTPEPPPYCSADMSTRDIPPLTDEQAAKVTKLVQVQAVIRHGSRTPYAPLPCWKNYDVSWNDCNVTDLMLGSDSYTSQNFPANWIFRKKYDGSPNELGGNCMTGQLIGRGFEQELELGRILEAAYVGNGTNANLRLFPSNDWDSINASRVYLRADDSQRTLMSGELLMTALFNKTAPSVNTDGGSVADLIPIHTGDYSLDTIYPNSKVCPRMNDVNNAAYSSTEYQAMNTSAEVLDLDAQLNAVLGEGYWDWNNIMDCFETTACTDRPLPSNATGATPGALMTDQLFNASIAHAESIWAFRALYNNSWWSKLAMGHPLWNIKTRMQAAASDTDTGSNDFYQLVIYAAHDTTVMPMLAAIFGDQWDGLWAGYASLLSYELYSTPTTGTFMFRIIYNGKPLVVPGCSDSLCNMDTLVDVLSFAQETMPCTPDPVAVIPEEEVICDESNDSMSESEWVETVVLCSVASWVLGMVGVYALIYFGFVSVNSRAVASSHADAILEDKSNLLNDKHSDSVSNLPSDSIVENQL